MGANKKVDTSDWGEPEAPVRVDTSDWGEPELMPAPKAKPQVGMAETFINRAANALPLGRPIVDLIGAGMMQGPRALGMGDSNVHFTPEALAEAKARGIPLGNEGSTIPGALDSYRRLRDVRSERTDAGSEQNKWTGRLGTGAGIALSVLAPLPKGLGGTGLAPQAARVVLSGGKGFAQAAKVGATLGGIQALGDSSADLTTLDPWEYAKAGLDTALGGTVGAVAGTVGHGIGLKLPEALRYARGKLGEWAAEKGAKVLTSGSGQMVPGGKQPVSPEAVKQALDLKDIAVWGTTKGAYERLAERAETKGAVYGSILDELEKRGVQGPQKEALAEKLMAEYSERYANSGANKAAPNVFRREAANLSALPHPEAAALRAEAEALKAAAPPPPVRPPRPRDGAGRYLKGALPPLAPAPPPDPRIASSLSQATELERYLGLRQAENVKRALQSEAKWGRIDKNATNEALKDAASIFRQANEDAVESAGRAAGPGSEIANIAETFVPVKKSLALTLEARMAAQRGAAAAAHRTGGAAGVNAFDVSNMQEATNTSGLTSAALAMLGKIWKERGPSTMARLYNAGSNASGRMANLAQASSARGLYGGYLGTGAERALMSPILGPGVGVNEDEWRTRALIEALRNRGTQ